MSAPTLSAADLPPDLRKRVGIRTPRKPRTVSKNDVRALAIRVLAVVADLTPNERRRVLAHAAKLNDV
jgi:hypothetical protein